MLQSLIKLSNVSKQFNKSEGLFRSTAFSAVHQATIEIYKGQSVGLIGESGSGKSTLGKLICRLVNTTSGEIIYDGVNITHYSNKQMKPFYQRIQMIFQDNSSALNPRIPIGKQIVQPMLRFGIVRSIREAKPIALQWLNRVGLTDDYYDRFPHECSGGQRQRVGIARALAVQAEFLILDEPTSALDVSIQAQILNLLLDLKDEYKLTYLFIGHNLAVINFFCDKIIVMDNGEIVEELEGEKPLSKAKHPSTLRLLDSVLTV